jgi:hypothetical protein
MDRVIVEVARVGEIGATTELFGISMAIGLEGIIFLFRKPYWDAIASRSTDFLKTERTDRVGEREVYVLDLA